MTKFSQATQNAILKIKYDIINYTKTRILLWRPMFKNTTHGPEKGRKVSHESKHTFVLRQQNLEQF